MSPLKALFTGFITFTMASKLLQADVQLEKVVSISLQKQKQLETDLANFRNKTANDLETLDRVLDMQKQMLDAFGYQTNSVKHGLKDLKARENFEEMTKSLKSLNTFCLSMPAAQQASACLNVLESISYRIDYYGHVVAGTIDAIIKEPMPTDPNRPF